MAGPGSGKTRVLVHKLASLLLLEDIKHEQLLMLTFSRSAATEFKQRLMALIGNAAHYVEIKTFHSYCFDLLGKVGSLEDSADIVQQAADMIGRGEVELGRITKSVLVIDEAQDMDEHEAALVHALMKRNEDMRIIAVGDDDQNIYEFRGSDSRHMKDFLDKFGAARYELLDNYRTSSALPMCLKLLETFTSVNRTKYRTDLIEFIHESKLEDFIEDAANTILVSTMHKAKGREFDRVYLLLNRSELTEASAKRVVYVALTRARRELHVHYTGQFMEGQSVPGAAYRNDNALYPDPEEIVLHLTHRDVVLDFFKGRKRQNLTLRSGQTMTGDGAYLLCDGRRVVKLS